MSLHDVWQFVGGFQDAISMHRILIFFVNSETVGVNTAKCALLNGLIFVGSIQLFDWLLMPVIHIIPHVFLELRDGSGGVWVTSLIDWLVFTVYHLLWLFPVYCISFILSTIWYQEIADQVYLLTEGKAAVRDTKSILRDEIYRFLVVAALLLQTSIISLIPLVGTGFSFVYTCWVYSLYCFEYKWALQGWDLERRFRHLETNWAYFAGFGAPCTLVTFFWPKFVSLGVFAVFFPLFVMVAFRSHAPLAATQQGGGGGGDFPRLPIFRYAKQMSLHFMRALLPSPTSGRSKKKTTAAAANGGAAGNKKE